MKRLLSLAFALFASAAVAQSISPAGGGGTPGGSNTQLQYNNSGAFGGAAGLTTDGANLTLGSSSILKWSTDNGISRLGAASLAIGNGTAGDFSGSLKLTNLNLNGNALLYGDAANTLALRNGVNAQMFNIYNTYTDASNYERGAIDFSSNAFYIQTQAAGTGIARDLYIRSASNAIYFGTGGTQNWQISSGNLLASNDNTFDIGSSGAYRPRNAYVGTRLYASNSITAPTYFFGASAGGSIMGSPADGVITLQNNAQTDFARLQLGGTTSSFPAIKRNAAAINFRLADDSADAAIVSSTATHTAAAPTVSAGQIGYGGTTAAAANCNVTSPTPTGCVVVNIAGTTRYIPYY